MCWLLDQARVGFSLLSGRSGLFVSGLSKLLIQKFDLEKGQHIKLSSKLVLRQRSRFVLFYSLFYVCTSTL